MSTPSYLGQNQPTGDSGGLLGRIGSFFGGGGTPAYAAAGQLAATNANASSSTPGYAPARGQAEATGSKHVCVCMQAKEPEATECPLDPEALAAGQIAIVIPR